MKFMLFIYFALILAMVVGCTRNKDVAQERAPTTTTDTATTDTAQTTTEPDNVAANTSTDSGAEMRDDTSLPTSGALVGAPGGIEGNSGAMAPPADKEARDVARAKEDQNREEARRDRTAATQPQTQPQTPTLTHTEVGSPMNKAITPGNELGAITKGSGHIEKDFTRNVQKRVSYIDQRIASLKERVNQKSGERKINISAIDQKRNDLNAMMAIMEVEPAQGSTDWQTNKVKLAKAIGSLETDVKRAENKLK